ncbi:tetratricopeptide repeat protein [Neopusillimonas aromaticivorans]|uniref:tetratricopeptide repeat protein n=1 Tax=Neopusillimonas aromaticivorans TaxID=2979868 RepID=UPI002598A7DC|nr:tetratricopeptide repeat protein [Neopusillimonas aromaticivorans]WJJ94203.1 tetratricopeptide repeat protein [Neopusillimonas aromaticivorans]
MTPELLYRLMVAEFAVQRGELDLGAELLLRAARDTSDPRLAKRAFQLSMVGRNFALANQAAQLWALVAPNDPEAVASSLALSASSGQTAGLSAALWKRIENAEDKDLAIGQAAAIVGKLSDKRAAFEVLNAALRALCAIFPSRTWPWRMRHWAAQDAERALVNARRAQELDPSSEQAAQRLLEYGLKVDPAAALASAQAFVARYPQTERLGALLVSRLAERGDYTGALALVQQMRRNTPENFDLQFTEAEVNFRAGRLDAAKALLNDYITVQTQRRLSLDDKASDAMADASDARLMLVRIAEQEGKLHEAIEQLKRIDEPALEFQVRVHEATLYGRLGDLVAARKTIESITPQSDNERAVLAMSLASIYRDAGRTDLAIQTLAKANTAVADSAEIKYDLAMLYERQGNFQAFERLMREVMALRPDDANAYNSLGYTFADQNIRLDEAQRLLEQALSLEPDNPYILDSVGWYLYRTGDYESAAEYLERSYKKLPAADVAAHLGEVYWAMGRKEDARKIWAEALKKDPGNDVLVKTMQRFGVK